MIKVNLLPPEIRQEQKIARENAKILRTIFILVVTGLIILAFFGGELWYFNGKLADTNKALSQKEESIKKYGDLEDKSQKIAERINNIGKIMDSSNVWSGTIEEIQKIMPAGVTLSTIRIDSSAKTRATITGYAISKIEVAALRDAMDKSEKFEYVDIESSQTETNSKLKRDVENFTLSFSLSKGALK